MKFQISPLIRKIANVGTAVALINNGTDPQMAARYGQLAEGMLSGISLKNDKENVMARLQKSFIDNTFQILKYEADIEIQYETAKTMAEYLFNQENFYQYIETIDSEALLVSKFKQCCAEYELPFEEQELDVNHIVQKIIFGINNSMVNDIHFLLIILLIHSYESRRDIADIKKSGTDTFDDRKKEFKYNQKGQFIEKWETSLFLHKNIRLCDIYTQLNYSCRQYKTNMIENLLLNYLSDEKRQILFLFGNPGLGKSSLISYFAKMFKNEENYIFIKMHDLEPRIAKDSLLDAVIDFLECKRRDLENTVIFLDGYDELRVDSMHYNLCLDFIAELKQIRAKAIISSRLNYIDLNKSDFNRDFPDAVVVELQPFNKQQMFEYIEKFEYISKAPIQKVKESFNNKTTEAEVYGIPFILYLICSLNIDINQMTDMQSIYDKVFAFDGGIYDKIYDEDTGHYLTQNPQCKRDLLKISMEIAYKMFASNELFVEKEIVDKEIISKYPQRKNTYALGNYYYMENDKVYFVHKTFQEYFACRYLVSSLEDLIKKYTDGQINMEEAAQCMFDMLYCDNYLYKRMEHIFKSMFQNNRLIQIEENRKAFLKFIPYLYDFYINNLYRDLSSKNNILKSQNYLSSLHKIINFGGISTFEGVDQFKVSLILRNKYYVIMNVNGLKLDDSDLSGAYLKGTFNQCKFSNVNFCRCDLHNSYINSTDFNHCKISMLYGKKACFNDSKLYNLKLINSNLEETNFNSSDFKESIFRGVDFNHADFNQCIFENTRFINCDFSFSSFYNIESSTRFYACRFFETKFINIADKLHFYHCSGDYKNLKSDSNEKEDHIEIIEERPDYDNKAMTEI